MGVSQHPSTELRSNYGIGNVAPGAALAIAAHMDLCRACRIALDRIDTPPIDFDIIEPAPPSKRRAAAVSFPDPPAQDASNEGSLPETLKGIEVGRWRRFGPGLRTAPLAGRAGLGESVHLLNARPGASLPVGRFGFVLVLSGLLDAGAMTYEAGDFLQFAGGDDERFRAGATGCHCLVVGDDELHSRPLSDWLRRLLDR